ncbi:MAG: histidine kinase dimerization/phospho-acceptor domain-containing protein, partial [bacterium]|nr:histidine kinase dimerization/phospho-acceptor domain-containing protein [bacterium]
MAGPTQEEFPRTFLSLKVSLVALILAFGGAAFLLYLLGMYESGLDIGSKVREDTERIAVNVAHIISKRRIINDPNYLQELLGKHFNSDDRLRAEVVSLNGTILACNHDGMLWKREQLEELERVFDDVQPLPIDAREEFLWAYIVPLFDRRIVVGALVIKQLREDRPRSLPLQVQAGLIVGGLLLVCVFFMLGWTAYRRTARVKEISGVATEVIGGKLWRRAPVVDDDRLGSLARSFNQIIDNLERQIRESKQAYEELSEANRKLEKVSFERARLLKENRLFNVELKGKVKEATQELKDTNRKLDSKLRELATLEKFNESIFNSITSGIIAVNVRGKITFINPEGRHILELGELKKKWHCTRYLSKGSQALAEHLLETLECGEDRIGWEIQVTPPSGHLLQLGVSSSLLRDYSGKTIGVVAIFRDITETKRLQHQVQRQERLVALGQLAAGVAHEIRNPLGGILGFTELLGRDLPEDDHSQNYVKKIVEEVDHLNKIVGNILDFARSQKPNPVFVDVNDVIENALALAQHKIEKYQVTVKTNLDQDIPGVLVDHHQIRQVFLNIIYNACESMVSGGTLRLVTGARQDTREVYAEFHDTGSGLNLSQREQVFNPFYTT